MSRLVIKNFGPIRSVNIETKRYNIFIGPQGSGKSCLMKVLSFCQWVEKRIELTQAPELFGTLDFVEKQLIRFHRLEGYVKEDSFIQYDSQYMEFSYDFNRSPIDMFEFDWKKKRWEYTRGNITYIPAERNISFLIPNWFEMKFYEDNLQNYLADWDDSRKFFTKKEPLPILDLGVKYYYDPSSNTDKLVLGDGNEIEMSNAASGFQSVTPLMALVWYRSMYLLMESRKISIKEKMEQEQLSDKVRAYVLSTLKETGVPITLSEQDHAGELKLTTFPTHKAFDEYERIVNKYEENHYTSLLIEEPEENLFPQAQYELVKWLVRQVNPYHNLFLTTHSPYILSAFNNLIQAAECVAMSESNKEKVGKILGTSQFIQFDDVRVYSIQNGKTKNIMDKEFNLISQSQLDSVSDVISKDFSKMLEL